MSLSYLGEVPRLFICILGAYNGEWFFRKVEISLKDDLKDFDAAFSSLSYEDPFRLRLFLCIFLQALTVTWLWQLSKVYSPDQINLTTFIQL